MKRFFTLLAGLALLNANAQEKAWKTNFHADPLARFYLFYPTGIGDNMLTDGHHGNIGVGINMSFVYLYGFHIGAGYSLASYGIDDKSIAGNFSSTNMTSLYPFVSYEVNFGEKFAIYPEIGGGWGLMNQKSGARHAYQSGSELRLGFYANYKCTRHFSLYTGVTYQYDHLNVETTPDLRDYYGKLQQLQFCLGLQIEGKPKAMTTVAK